MMDMDIWGLKLHMTNNKALLKPQSNQIQNLPPPLVEMKHRYDIKKASFDGFYTYFASNGFTYGSSWKNWKGLAGILKTDLFFQFYWLISASKGVLMWYI